MYRNKIPFVQSKDYYNYSSQQSDRCIIKDYQPQYNLPPIKKSKAENYYSPQNLIKDIYANQDYNQTIRQGRTIRDRKARKMKAQKNVFNQIVDLRKGSSLNTYSRPEFHSSYAKDTGEQGKNRRIISLPSQQIQRYSPVKYYQVKSSLDHYPKRQKINKKYINPQNYYDEKVYLSSLVNKSKPKKKKIKEKQLRTSYYQYVRINGKQYLVRRKLQPKIQRVKVAPRIIEQSDYSDTQNSAKSQSQSDQLSYQRDWIRTPIDQFSLLQKNQKPSLLQTNKNPTLLTSKVNRHKQSKSNMSHRTKTQPTADGILGQINQQLKRQQLYEETGKLLRTETYFQIQERENKYKTDVFLKNTKLNTMNEKGDNDEIQSEIFHKRNSHPRTSIYQQEDQISEDGNRRKKDKNQQDGDDEAFSIKFPKVSEIVQAIESYRPLTKFVDTFLLTKSPNYIRQHSEYPGREFFYFGQFDNKVKKRTGRGVMVTKQKILEGMWKNGQLIEGAELKPKGIYKGFFQKGQRHGEGTYEWINGESYSGAWRYGKRHGKGQWKSKKGQVYTGQWKAGNASGYGELNSLTDGIYKGQFLNFVKHGRGKQKFPNGDFYQGLYSEGVPHGPGKYIWQSKLVFEGNFKDSVRQGKGILRKQGIFSLEGEFKSDVPHGICKLKLSNGEQHTCKFSYGDTPLFIKYQKDQILKGILGLGMSGEDTITPGGGNW